MSGPAPSSRASALVLLVGVAAVSTGALFARLAEAPALALSFWRCAVAGGLLSAWAAPRLAPELGALRRGEVGLLLLAGALLALHFASWITSLEHTSVASSVLLVNTGPIWVGLATPWLTRDRLGRGARLGIGCSVLGSAVVAWGDQALSPEALWGDALALVGALAASGYLLVGRRLRARLSLPVYTGAVYGSAALALLVAAPAAGAALVGFPAATWGWILALALVPQLVGHTAANWALGHVSAALVAVSLLGEPVLAGLGAAVVLHELPPPAFLAGSPLILAGILLTARGERT
ncbi:MAG: DMT family transporter [Planctomycetes bacterium]|nr:DMT family transporter [Planctomycetota bacterium]